MNPKKHLGPSLTRPPAVNALLVHGCARKSLSSAVQYDVTSLSPILLNLNSYKIICSHVYC